MIKCEYCGQKMGICQIEILGICPLCAGMFYARKNILMAKMKNSFMNKIRRFWSWFSEGCENG